jgi:hypothetical protein
MAHIGIASIVVIVISLLVWRVVKGSKDDSAKIQFLTQTGFTDCLEEKTTLEEKIVMLENNSEYSYHIDRPMKCTSDDGTTVYYYIKHRHRQGSEPYAAEEFLITLKRKVSKPFVLYIKPGSMKEGMGVQLLRTFTTKNWDAHPDDLSHIELPRDLKKSNIIGVLGPEDASIYELVDSAALSLLMQAGDYGVCIFRSRDNMCSFDNPGNYLKWDMARIWSFIQLIANS